jgi:phage terminase large subunit
MEEWERELEQRSASASAEPPGPAQGTAGAPANADLLGKSAETDSPTVKPAPRRRGRPPKKPPAQGVTNPDTPPAENSEDSGQPAQSAPAAAGQSPQSPPNSSTNGGQTWAHSQPSSASSASGSQSSSSAQPSSTASAGSSPAPSAASSGPAPQPSGNPYLDFIVRYRDDPVGFVQNVLEVEPDEWQKELLAAIAAGKRRISVRSGHGVGKSTGASWAVLWFATTRYPQKTVITAPTASQLFDALFAELKHWLNKLPPFIRTLFDVNSERIALCAAPESSFVSARTSSKEKPEALAGIHSDNVLLVVDEASGVDEAVFESAIGSMSGDNATTIMLGNPTRSSGMFYKTHHELAAEWHRIHVDASKSPRVHADFVKQVRDTYGENSNAFRVRVLGEFPLADDDTLIPAEHVDSAMSRDVILDPRAPRVYGVDPARFGDDKSVLIERRGDYVMPPKKWGGLDLMALAGAIVHEIDGDKTVPICVDTIGLGAGLADRLREMGYNVIDVNVSETSAFNPKANKLRDDLWMQVRDWLAMRVCRLPKDEDLRADLITPKYKFSSTGKLIVEPKAEMKKRLRRSPDSADALALTFASEIGRVGGRSSSQEWSKPLKRGVSVC